MACGATDTCARGATRSKRAHRRSSATSSGTSCSACRGAIDADPAGCGQEVRTARRGEAMQFGLSESQEILKDSARKFFAGECPMAEVRRLMETETAYDAALWAKLAAQGYTGVIFPEEYGGAGLGKVELILLM